MDFLSDATKSALAAYDPRAMSFLMDATSGAGPRLSIKYTLNGKDGPRSRKDGPRSRVDRFLQSLISKIGDDQEKKDKAMNAFEKVLQKNISWIRGQSLSEASFAEGLLNAILATYQIRGMHLENFISDLKQLDASVLPMDHPLRNENIPPNERSENRSALFTAITNAKNEYEGLTDPQTGEPKPKLGLDIDTSKMDEVTLSICGAERPLTGKELNDFSHRLVRTGALPRSRRLDLENEIHSKMPNPLRRESVAKSFRF